AVRRIGTLESNAVEYKPHIASVQLAIARWKPRPATFGLCPIGRNLVAESLLLHAVLPQVLSQRPGRDLDKLGRRPPLQQDVFTASPGIGFCCTAGAGRCRHSGRDARATLAPRQTIRAFPARIA